MASADFTIAEFRAWVLTKPADEAFNFTDSRKCAIAQFGRATGRRGLIGLLSGQIEALTSFEFLWVLTGAETFGALAHQLERLLPASPVSDTWAKADAYLTDIEDVARERVSA